MEYGKIRQIVEVTNADEANKYLDLGWVLLGTASMDTDSREWSQPMIKYSLGWPHSEKPKMPDYTPREFPRR